MTSPLRREIEAAPEGVTARLRRVVAVPARLLGALVTPDRTLPGEVEAGRYGGALLAAILAALVGAAAIGARLDLTHTVLAANEPKKLAAGSPAAAAATGEDVKSDRELDEEIVRETAMKRVGLALSAGLGTPLSVLALAIGLYLLGRYVGGQPTMRRTVTAAAHGALPGAVEALIAAAAAWRTSSLQPDEVPTLVAAAWSAPAGPPALARLLGGADVFTLWSVVVLGFGLAAAARISRRRAFTALAVAFVVYLILTQLVAGGPAAPQGAS